MRLRAERDASVLVRCNPVGDDPPPAPDHPVMVDGAIYDGLRIRVRLYADDTDEWGRLDLEEDFQGVPWDTWLSFVRDCESLEEALGVPGDPCGGSLPYLSQVALMLMEHGIAPRQRFWVEMTYAAGCDSGGEAWYEIDWHVVHVEPLPAQVAAERWEALFTRKRILA